MIKVNGKIVEQNRFPDGTLCLNISPDEYDGTYYMNTDDYLDDTGLKIIKYNTITWLYENDAEMFTIMCLVDLIRRNTHNKIYLNMPYLCNARMDRIKSSNENFSLKVFCNWLNSLKFDKVIVNNVHSHVSEALIDNLESHLPTEDIFETCKDYQPDVIFFPDEGACKRYSDMNLIKSLNLPIAFGIKKRDWKTGKIEGLEIINGDVVKDKKVLIIDDIISRGYTFFYSGKELKKLGSNNIALYATHCENTIADGELLKNNSPIDKIYTTNSICTISHPKIKIFNRF